MHFNLKQCDNSFAPIKDGLNFLTNDVFKRLKLK